MKKIIIPFLLLLTTVLHAQLNNSWINYNQTYYKFTLGVSGLCRISQATLTAAGLGNTAAEQYQLWRNGQQVIIYTSVATGIFGANDYIEFLGKANDGVPDNNLYYNPSFQLSEDYSLFTDTVAYFLTINPVISNNLRYTNSSNTIAGNTLSPDNYCMRTIAKPFKTQINYGQYTYVGEPVYSASYDMGEGWTSSGIVQGYDLSQQFDSLNVYQNGPANSVSLYVSAFANENIYNTSRDLKFRIFNTQVFDTNVSAFAIVKKQINNLPLSDLPSDYAPVYVGVYNSTDSANDQAVVAKISLTYPATFNFNNLANFCFQLVPSTQGDYLVINNFNSGAATPVLYDITDGYRYIGNISNPGTVQFLLPPSTETNRQFMLVSEDPSNITAIGTLTTRSFINYSVAGNQGNYIIISNPTLYNDGSGHNYVAAYQTYRSTLAGGGYNPITISVNELTDQFGFGIKKHPAAIRDFIISTQNSSTWAVKPKYVFFIGRGMTSIDYRLNESSPYTEQLDPVLSFGWPASDVLLACYEGQNVPLVPIGRLPVVSGAEIAPYLSKVEAYEQAQAAAQLPSSQPFANVGWMKDFLHLAGGSDSAETAEFSAYLNGYAAIAEDSLMGATVSSFATSSTAYVQQGNTAQVQQLINNGESVISYFGHAAATILEFNLGSPTGYQNLGKYPFFNVSGCTAGDFYTFDPTRLGIGGPKVLSISEDWVLANQCGSIGFLADTHLGIPYYLDPYNSTFYNEFSYSMYGNTVGNQIKQIAQTIWATPSSPLYQAFGNNYDMRLTLEEINLDGDPAIKINSFALPDYDVESQDVKINPSIISVADSNFTVAISMYNIGRSVNGTIPVTVTWKLPNGKMDTLYNKVIPAILYEDTLNFTLHINPLTDAGMNSIIVSINQNETIPESNYSNNSVTKSFTIYQDDLSPVYPYNYSIVNQQNITFSASTANPLGTQRQYQMEIDTTALFNSPLMKTYTASGPGGVIQFSPTNISFVDSTVYYWRVSVVPVNSSTPVIWNSFSFIYLPTGGPGFNQSHYYQYLNDSYNNIVLDSDRVFRFTKVPASLVISTGLFPSVMYYQIYTELNNAVLNEFGCQYNSLQVMVFDSSTLVPWQNYTINGSGRFGSWNTTCSSPTIRNFFEFPYGPPAGNTTYMKNLITFLLDSIPNGKYVSITNFGVDSNSYGVPVNNSFISNWMTDLVSNQSLYSTLKSIGFTKIDSFTHNLPFIFFYQKGVSSFTPSQVMGITGADLITDTLALATSNISGTITSPLFGPATAWQSLHWLGKSVDPGPGDTAKIQVYGVGQNGTPSTLLATVSPATDTSLSFIKASTYPYIQLVMQNRDSIYATPSQLSYWRINGSYVPEGAVAPNLLYTMQDTVQQGAKIVFTMAFKNVSPVAFDSLSTTFQITNNVTNQTDTFKIPKGKALAPGDTLIVRDTINTANLAGSNTLYVMVNPYYDQPEQYLFNNYIYQNFYVIPDKYDPTLDVTFDGVHILNKDLVSSKPHITIKLTDPNQFLALSDTAYIKVQVYFPDPTGNSNGTLVTYHFGDSMQFIPANLSSGQNTATINLLGNFPIDGQYELIVSGQDVEGNTAGNLEYRIAFNVINKTMISNLFNYPNPFTTSTAFVFTLTGSVLPQNMRIQILTITGKVVKEITQSELGPLHVGDNITQYKWNGTDMYGQKLSNGVYLYRVLTNLNGKSIEKYSGTNANGDVISSGLNNTDQYFTKGYGKMYLMR